MTYATVMVHVDLDQGNEARLQVAGDLAETFNAKVIGVTACDRSSPLYYEAGAFAENALERERDALRDEMEAAGERFRRTLRDRIKQIEWRSALDLPIGFVAQQARA